MKRTGILFFMLLFFAEVFSQSCKDFLNTGKEQFNLGNYAEAKEYFDWVLKYCRSQADKDEAKAWINEVDTATRSTLSVSGPTTIQAASTGGNYTIQVTSNRSWRFTRVSNAAFTVNKIGNSLEIVCPENTSTTAQNGSFTIFINENRTKDIKVTISQAAATPVPQQPDQMQPAPTQNQNQQNYYLSASTKSVQLGATAGSQTIQIRTNGTWHYSAVNNANFSQSRNGNNLTISAVQNSTASRRNGTFTVYINEDRNKDIRITVSQDAANKLTVSTNSLSFSEMGGKQKIVVSTNLDWGFTHLYSDKTQRERSNNFTFDRKNDTLFVACKENPYYSARKGYLKIFARGYTNDYQDIELYQQAKTSYSLIVTAAKTNFESSGGYTTLQISTNAKEWYVTECSNWLRTPARTTSSLDVSCGTNYGASSRTGKITIKAGDQVRTIYFSQNATQTEEPAKTALQPPSGPGKYRAAKNYYNRNGVNYLSIISGGYTFDFADNVVDSKIASPLKHVVDMSILDWRVRWFGMSLLNFEMELGDSYADHFDHRAIYKPSFNFYIPISEVNAIKLYGGAECDMSYVYKANPDYDYSFDRDFFFNIDAGIGFQVVPFGAMPIEFNCEYRYPVKNLTKDQNRLSQGFYVTSRFYLGVPIRK